MIKGFLTFLIEKEPELQTILFYDTSTFACNFLNDDYSFDISLPYHNFIVYGKTWYERSLNATIKDNVDDSLLLLHSPIKDEILYNKIQQQEIWIQNSLVRLWILFYSVLFARLSIFS